MKGSNLVLEGFLVCFLYPKSMRNAKMRFMCNINKTLRGRMNFEVRPLQHTTKIEPKSMKNRMFFGTSILDGFWEILRGFWEVKILDFRIFFDVFSKHFSNNFLESQKIQKISPKKSNSIHFGTARRNARPPGREKERGSED